MAKYEEANLEITADEESVREITTEASRRKSDHDISSCHKITHGGEHIPRVPLELYYVQIVISLAVIQLSSGILITCLSVAITCLFGSSSSRQCPALWWTGLAPTILGICGTFTSSHKNRRIVYKWGLASIVVMVTESAVMGVVGNLSPALYSAWLTYSEYQGYPVCQGMEGRCFCQDYFHNIYSSIKMPGVVYIHEGVKWKDTGFLSCQQVNLVSNLYIATLSFFGLSGVASLAAYIVSLRVSVCARTGLRRFQRLEETDSGDGDICPVSVSDTVAAMSVHDKELQDMTAADRQLLRMQEAYTGTADPSLQRLQEAYTDTADMQPQRLQEYHTDNAGRERLKLDKSYICAADKELERLQECYA